MKLTVRLLHSVVPVVVFLLVGALAPDAARADGTGLQTAVAADIVGRFDAGRIGSASNRLEAREAEVLFFAPIDHIFDGQLSLAAHQEGGKFSFELHEMFIGSTKLIPRSRFRVGQFFLGIGRLNQFHRHDWPFITRPKVQFEFLGGDEGAIDSGIEYSYLLPLPFYLDVTLGITNGWVFGHSHTLGAKPKVPVHYLRLATYQQLFTDVGAQLGLNYLGRTDINDVNTKLLGVDLTAKWRDAQRLKLLFQTEFWMRLRKSPAAPQENTLGFYVYPQYGFTDTLSFGMRFDGYSVLNSGSSNFEYAFVPTLTWKASEFSTFRAAYTYLEGDNAGTTTTSQRVLELQAVFILGAHPAHDF